MERQGQDSQRIGSLMPQHFSPEEIRAFQECEKESIVQRSIPLSTILGFASYYGIQKGYLKPNQKFGAFPKVTLAIVVGYFVGKVSYQGACAEKLMALPNSYVGQLLRERRSGITGTSTRFPSKTMLGVTEDDIYSDAGPGNSLDLDTSRPIFSDDSYRPGSELAPNLSPPDEKRPQSPMSYEELRRRNRGENDSRDPYKVTSGDMPVVRRPPPTTSSPRRNQYGDEME